jgi:hypothetical protein
MLQEDTLQFVRGFSWLCIVPGLNVLISATNSLPPICADNYMGEYAHVCEVGRTKVFSSGSHARYLRLDGLRICSVCFAFRYTSTFS